MSQSKSGPVVTGSTGWTFVDGGTTNAIARGMFTRVAAGSSDDPRTATFPVPGNNLGVCAGYRGSTRPR